MRLLLDFDLRNTEEKFFGLHAHHRLPVPEKKKKKERKKRKKKKKKKKKEKEKNDDWYVFAFVSFSRLPYFKTIKCWSNNMLYRLEILFLVIVIFCSKIWE